MPAKQPPENKRLLPSSQKGEGAESSTQSDAPAHTEGGLSQLQRTAGNAAVQRMLAQRQGNQAPAVDEETAGRIQRKLGGGQAIDGAIAAKAGDIVGDDYSEVRVHNDGEADQLSRQLGAKAFTTGNDIFFQKDAYDPHSNDGQKLLTHELTHVTQQGGQTPGVQAKLEVNEPDDPFEKQADQMANQLDTNTAAAPAVQREALPEEEMQLKRADQLQREALPEEEMQLKADQQLQREALPEEEMQLKADQQLQRQELPEEELQMKADKSQQGRGRRRG
ncbi:MAG: DUF4157 domain-containing protein [Anaerolineales bacterium]|nr:DUF4157 domain-containing protein [Anaerolineales bacterium]MCB8961714.1 DUF4157 domain-containing protein [Ardenticatenales bacterium]